MRGEWGQGNEKCDELGGRHRELRSQSFSFCQPLSWFCLKRSRVLSPLSPCCLPWLFLNPIVTNYRYSETKTETAMATHSSTLAWKLPWTEEPGRLQSMGSRRVRRDWATSLSLFTFMHWRRKWQPIPAFLPGESQGRRSLVGWRLRGHTESDTTEAT